MQNHKTSSNKLSYIYKKKPWNALPTMHNTCFSSCPSLSVKGG